MGLPLTQDAGVRATLNRMSCYFARGSGLGRLGTGTTIAMHDRPVARARRRGVGSLAAMFLAGPLDSAVSSSATCAAETTANAAKEPTEI